MEERLNTGEQTKKTMSDEEDYGEKETGEQLGRGTELLRDLRGSLTRLSWGEGASQPAQNMVSQGEGGERGWRGQRGETPGWRDRFHSVMGSADSE